MARTTTQDAQDVPQDAQDVPQETAQETAQKFKHASTWTSTAIQTAIALAEKAAHYTKVREEQGIGGLFVRENGKDVCIVAPPVYMDDKGNERSVKSSRILEIFVGLSREFRWLDAERLQVAVAASSLLAECWQEWEQTVGKMQASGKTFAEKANGLPGAASFMQTRVEAVKEAIPQHIVY